MKKQYTLFFAAMIISIIASAQTTVTLKLNANEEDATIDDYNPGNNYPNEIEYYSGAWTISGTPVVWRNLFKFNLNYIPSNATITGAYLNLYFATQNSFNGTQSSLTSSNESVIQRVTSPWSENSVTWNNQPSATVQDQDILPQSVSSTQDYTNVDVTAMVQYMFNNPSSNFGFMLKLTNETYYASMIFASGDNPDSSKHPELVITYTTPCTVLTIDANGEDATIDDYNPGNNYPDEIEYYSGAWTISGTPVVWRNLFKFDFSSIPVNATVQSADLNLFYAPNNSFVYAQDTSLTSSNESVLQKVNVAWAENTVTWNNQPATGTTGQVILPQTTSQNEDYLNMDVTGMVQDMVTNPSTNFGFMLKLTTENYYAQMIFASGDNPVAYMHPQLEVCFTVPTIVEELNNSSAVNIYPNPSSGNFSVSWDPAVQKFDELSIVNTLGQEVNRKNISSQTNAEVNLTGFSKGIYILQLSGSTGSYIKKIAVQ